MLAGAKLFEPRPLDQQHARAGARHQRGERGAGGSAAEDADIVAFRHAHAHPRLELTVDLRRTSSSSNVLSAVRRMNPSLVQ